LERPRVWVIDNSLSVQETIAIVLGGDCDVVACTPDEFSRRLSQGGTADLLVVGTDAFSSSAVSHFPPRTPVLWVQGRNKRPFTGADPRRVLVYPFRPEDLRARVRSMLVDRSQSAAAPRQADIEFPFFPHDAISLAVRAASNRLPVLICGEPGTGKLRLARSIHALGGSGRLTVLPAPSCSHATLRQSLEGGPAGDLTLVIAEIAEITADGEPLVLELIESGQPVRLICTSVRSLEELAAGLSRELYYRICVLPITLPPLRERAADIRVLAEHVASRLARTLCTVPISFTPRALERLERYLWFGNVAEFETVLTRSIVLGQRSVLDLEDLLFGYGRLTVRELEEPIQGGDVVPKSMSSEAVDLIVNELAHEFKNPMVTIKTVAQHLERLLTDDAGREQVSRLTGEAVDRMDRTLENLLQFTRFREPAPCPVPLSALLAPCFAELTSLLAERRVTLQYDPPAAVNVFVDPAQITYAFENLLRVITRDLGEGQTLSVHAAGGTLPLTFEFDGARHPLAGKLSEYLDSSPEKAQEMLPVGLVFAKTLVERNGGRIELGSSQRGHRVSIWLPNREEIAN